MQYHLEVFIHYNYFKMAHSSNILNLKYYFLLQIEIKDENVTIQYQHVNCCNNWIWTKWYMHGKIVWTNVIHIEDGNQGYAKCAGCTFMILMRHNGKIRRNWAESHNEKYEKNKNKTKKQNNKQTNKWVTFFLYFFSNWYF